MSRTWEGRKTADTKEFEAFKNEAATAKAAAAPADVLAPRPDLNGLRVKLPHRSEIYLILDGCRRWIPSPAAYNRLFRDWNGVVVDIDIDEIPLAAPLSDGAVLIKGDGTAPVYLVSNNVKRWITSPAAMDKYYFNWSKIQVVAPILVNNIPTGPDIS